SAGAGVIPLFLGAITFRQLFLLGVLLRGGGDHRLDDLLVGDVAILLDLPLLAVPRVYGRAAATGVVGAGGADWQHVALEAQFLDGRRVDRQVLQAPADFLALERFL